MISDAKLEEQYPNLRYQAETAVCGMWVFLASELLFFGTLFVAYGVMRAWYWQAFAIGSQRMHLWIGSANTAILFASSFTMALAVHFAQRGKQRGLVACLATTAFLGLTFDSLKGLEYTLEAHDGLFPGPGFKTAALGHGVELFFVLYFVMTGLHAVHLIVGVAIVFVLTCMAVRGRFTATDHLPIWLADLYWNFVDMVWILLFPLFYLISP